jgi:peptidyl-dipeptidase Dcp
MTMDAVIFALASQEYAGLLIASLGIAAGIALTRFVPKPARYAGLALAGVSIVAALGSMSHLVRLAALGADFPAPGEFVNVHGTRIHLIAEGPESRATLVWFGGGHAGGLSMYPFHAELRTRHRSVLIDRPGTGWSDTGRFPRTTAREADEMIAALDAAGEEGPFIFVGHSFGGLLAANIARRYPDRTAALILLDPTPPDVLMYGLDRTGLGSLETMSRSAGWRYLFGLYGFNRYTPPRNRNGEPDVLAAPRETLEALNNRAGIHFASASIYSELTPDGFAELAFETHVFEGDLGDLPLFLIAPRAEPQIDQYAAMIAKDPDQAERFLRFLRITREQFLRASSNATRIYAPEGTGHNFIYEAPDFLPPVINEIIVGLNLPGPMIESLLEGPGPYGGLPLLRVSSDATLMYAPEFTGGNVIYEAPDFRRAVNNNATDERSLPDPMIETLLEWPGPYGGLPPVSRVTPDRIEAACLTAIAEKRASIEAISVDPAPATFENTVLAYERAGTRLARCQALLNLFASTARTPEVGEVAAAINPLIAALEAEIVANSALFARIEAIEAGLPDSAPDPVAARLTAVIASDLRHRGAALGEAESRRLAEIETRLALLQAAFSANVVAQEGDLVVYVEDEARLKGLTPVEVEAARSEAASRGRDGEFAIAIRRPSVWPVLQFAEDRALRKQVWDLWIGRGGFDGIHDNAPVMTEILSLRGEKAALMGYANFAAYQTAARMAGKPERPLDMMLQSWELILAVTESELERMQVLADAEGADFAIAAHDRLFYREKLREAEIGFSIRDIEPYLTLENVRAAMFDAAGRAYGFTFGRLADIETVAPEIEVYEVRQDGKIAGVLWMDLFQREGKRPSSWASQYRAASSFDGDVLPLVVLHSSAIPPQEGKPATMPFERANVIFHEFGHTLHTLSNTAPYPSLGTYTLPWDFIEAPALFHERWFMDETLMRRHLRHVETGASISDTLIGNLKASVQFDRVFSVTLDYLLTAITDMHLHLQADGREIDAQAVEAKLIADLGAPASVAPLLAVSHAFHTFSPEYAAGVYTYYWSDMIAADIAEQFLASKDGLYDETLNARYRRLILEPANTLTADQAVREFLGRDPNPDALLKRFDLLPTSDD